jgi:steroid 5-alpha reductase family enzyme
VPAPAIPRPGAPAHDRDRGRAALAIAYAAALAVALGVGLALRGRHPILVAAAGDVAATLVVFAFSVRHDNSSLYDPYWSVAPIPIALFWASLPAGGGSALRRGWVVLVVCAWGARLTANQLARWRGLGDEDFRYVELRARSGRAYWPLSLAGVHLMPTCWVFLGLLGAYPALAGLGRRWSALDALAVLVAGGAVLLEATADRQLRAFLRGRRDPAAVLDRGVWAGSRHPNYLGEILFWWGLWLSGVAAAPAWAWAWTAAGPLAITLLFLLVSVPWMDRRMLARHPAYAERLRATPALVPRPWRRR